MISSLLGAVLGLFFGGALSVSLYCRFDGLFPGWFYKFTGSQINKEDTKKLVFANKLFNIALCLFIVNLCSFTTVQISKEETRQYVQEYLAVKNTIETSIQNENITGFERIELVKQASEYNGELAELQYKCQQWYGFDIDRSVLELELINLE